MMNIRSDFSSFHRAHWYEYLIRFVLGGLATVMTGLLAKKFGPAIGGLFLAFPAILPAGFTLVETHERKKQRQKPSGALRARKMAGLDAAGASIGSIGLVVFAAFAWKLLPKCPSWLVLLSATGLWFAVAVVAWRHRRIQRLFR
jgi:Protein of unknown function (DUF3147)